MSPKKKRAYTRKPNPTLPQIILSDIWYTTAESAPILKIKKRALYYWLKNDRLAISKQGKKILINKADVDALPADNRRFG